MYGKSPIMKFSNYRNVWKKNLVKNRGGWTLCQFFKRYLDEVAMEEITTKK